MKNKILKQILIAFGSIAFAGAIVFAIKRTDFSVLSDASLFELIGLAAGITVNLLLTGVLFWAVTLPFDAKPVVGLGKMVQLILSSSVLNYLPLRAGLLGRAAYLKAKHQLPIKQSGIILLIVLVMGAVVLGSIGLSIVICPMQYQTQTILMVSLGLLAICPYAIKPVIQKLTARTIGKDIILAWGLIRLADMFVVGIRTWFAFTIAGCPISYTQAVAMGAVGMLVSLLGLTPNGLGLREWAMVGMTLLISQHNAAAGITAALVDRAMEVLVVCLVGLPATLLLAKQMPCETSAIEVDHVNAEKSKKYPEND